MHGKVLSQLQPRKNTLTNTNTGSNASIVINTMQIDNKGYIKVGLDMYAYVAQKAGQQNEYYGAEGDYVDGEWKPHKATVSKPREIAYWRKHPNLHGWMEKLWISKGRPGFDESSADHDPTFNGVELELTSKDLDDLERAVIHGQLPSTTGFFFGDGADDYYREHDLQFIKNARAELFFGLKVFYNSSW